ncbi:uncharacterized protein LOC124997350 isoform X1 [Xyrichtys novacula]|nr:uncharacterized protein LOC124997350 isoform X1 [Xyrichtys novacula]
MLLFDKMHGLTVLLLMIFISFRIKETQGCSTINKTCVEIKQEDGYGFVHNCRRGSRIRVSENEITVAYSYPEIKYLRKGMTLNDTTFVMQQCNNLKIKCTFNNGGRAEDICMDFNIIEPPKSLTSTSTTPPPVTAPPPNDQLITGLCIGICLIMIIGCIVGSHCGFFKSCCQKKQKEETEDQKSPDSNMDNSRNITIEMNGIQPANGACNENEKNGTLESVKVQSAEREAPPNLSPNHIAESDEENQAKDGGASVPERAITCRDMQR